MGCKHCFATEINNGECENSIDEVMNSIQKEKDEFEIIYVSHYKENFTDQELGIELCKRLFEKYKKDICITSRSVLNDEGIQKIISLNHAMSEQNCRIFWCESIPALQSAGITENLNKIPTPEDRLTFLGKLKDAGICAIITVRPLFPSRVIGTDEINKLLELSVGKVDAVITGGLILTDSIEKRLGLNTKNWKFYECNQSAYLIGSGIEKARYVDVDDEVKNLKSKCNELGLPFFLHSTEAINNLKSHERGLLMQD